MTDLLSAFGLMLVIEGLLYAAAPGRMRDMLRWAMELPDETLRKGGLVAAVAGLLLVWLIRG